MRQLRQNNRNGAQGNKRIPLPHHRNNRRSRRPGTILGPFKN